LFGESYAGKYVPAIAEYALKNNQTSLLAKVLKGAGIGDGFTDPNAIMSEMPNFGYNLGLIDF